MFGNATSITLKNLGKISIYLFCSYIESGINVNFNVLLGTDVSSNSV